LLRVTQSSFLCNVDYCLSFFILSIIVCPSNVWGSWISLCIMKLFLPVIIEYLLTTIESNWLLFNVNRAIFQLYRGDMLHVPFWRDYDHDIWFVLDQHAELHFYNANTLGKTFNGTVVLISSKLEFACTP
jgi:hypothetical protein